MKPRSIKVITLIAALAVIIAGFMVYRHFASPKIRNVVLISIDTCRADYLSCYGYQLKTTPNIDALAKKGILFENVYTPVPYTLPAHCSMLTGTVPAYHGVLDNQGYKLSEDNVTLAEILSDDGFTTAAFISTFILDSQFGLGQGFDSYDDEFEKERIPIGIAERTGDETTGHVIRWLEEKRGEKNFIFLHYFDPHFSYEAPEPFASRFQFPHIRTIPKAYSDYAGEIAFTDHCIGQMIQKLKELGLYDSALIVVTADHGESLGEHRENTHGYFIYQSTVKVPLLFIFPGGLKAKRIKATVGLVDILPTVCSLLGIESPNGIQGKDLNPYFKGQSQPYPDRHIFCQSLEPTVYMANSLLGVVNNRYKYIQTTRPELYDLIEDPQELNNLFGKQSNRARIMKDKLQQILELTVRSEASSDAKHELDEQSRKRLESLGYLGSSISEGFSFDQSKEDPKDAIDYHVLNTKLGPLVSQDKFVMARQVCEELISKRPWFYKPYFDLAKISAEEKKFEEVIALLEKTLEFKPGYITAYEGLADAYQSLSKFDKAVEQYLKVLEIEPDNVKAYFHMASLLYDQGEFAEADKYLSKDLSANPSYVEMILTLSDKLLEKKQIIRAHEYYLMAIKLKPDSEHNLNTLGWLEAASAIEGVRNPQQAIKYARKACRLSENKKPEFLDTLAVAYAADGEFKKAIENAEKAFKIAISEKNAALAGRIQARLELYKAGEAYLDPELK